VSFLRHFGYQKPFLGGLNKGITTATNHNYNKVIRIHYKQSYSIGNS